jgi:hypothetical protein
MNFLSSEDVDDVTLTQIGIAMENDAKLWGKLEVDDGLLSQCDMKCNFDFDFDFGFDIIESTSNSSRFAAPTTTNEFDAIIKKTESKNTRSNTTWAHKIFEDWKQARNKNGVQADIIHPIEQMTAEQLNINLSHFVLEVRKANGTDYPAKTLYSIIAGILRYLHEKDVHLNFLDTKDIRFHKFR